MNNRSLHAGNYIALIALILLIFTSCVPQKKIKYLQTLQEQDTTDKFVNKRPLDYKIQPNDNLYIRIFSLDEKTYLFFNMVSSANYNQYTNDASIYLNSYTVDPEGYIDFPIVGKVFIKDMTVEQVKDVLQSKVDEYLHETMVVVKMVNF
ncbi:MAG: polysaccharide biosynthesis/export family protein, partial [Bacteroidales bacterium]|nr:polysaccharide biosynthesis/export family protein [Bacteroidales bacterium]